MGNSQPPKMLPLGFEDFGSLDRVTDSTEEEYHFGLGSDLQGAPLFVDALDNFFTLLHSLQSNVTQEIRIQHDKLKDATQSIRRRLKREALEDKLRQQFLDLRARLAEPPVVALRHKVSFFLGVTNVVLAAFTFGREPSWIPALYSLDFAFLVALRVWIYRRKGWHYFTLDLCYYTNGLLLIYLFVMPESRFLLGGVIGLAHGPVLWAILQWRNSLVFHSLDKITSCFIHFCPAVVLYGIRWLTPRKVVMRSFPTVAHNSITWQQVTFPSIILHIVWQALYYIIVNVHKSEKVTSGKRVTSYTWLVHDGESRNSAFFRVVNCLGPPHRLAVYMSLQLLYTLLTVAPGHFHWNSWSLHTSLLVGMFSVCVWNGATYYVDVFSHSYARSITRMHNDILQSCSDKRNNGSESTLTNQSNKESPIHAETGSD
eukprot:Gregarina_sp_Poly_1__2931@NODE_181_length_11831_cov_65_262326_g161_i0_p3_GENE_NODE_181_length_11831_cov_65_262326_g161_i0NODE_181_length_11831_cov_65_262326_g161_i0_p3_ORF_typecomplete_len428_score33_00DUF2838/PF10998_8/9_1e38DUF2838/PF10998_8/2_6e03_NODE_181_length_11831_cov_65_262326_g161_i01007411357